MPRPTDRKFRISDAMILVVATSLPLAATRGHWAGYQDYFRPGSETYRQPVPNLLYGAHHLVGSASHFTAAWTLACLAIGLRRPRAGWRRALARPGMVACSTAAVVLGIRAVVLAVTYSVQSRFYLFQTLREVLETAPEIPRVPGEVGCAIAAAWAVQRLGGRWRPEAHWIDRMGRALGWAWIATILLAPFDWRA